MLGRDEAEVDKKQVGVNHREAELLGSCTVLRSWKPASSVLGHRIHTQVVLHRTHRNGLQRVEGLSLEVSAPQEQGKVR